MNRYILAVSGSQGTGKSTVVRGLLDLGVPVIDTQISRTAQKLLGWESLTRVEESEENMWLLQDTVLALMYDRDVQISKSGVRSVVERSPADVWAYTKLWCQRLGISEYSTRVQLYKSRCRDMMNMYRGTFLLYPMKIIPFQEDKNRADYASRDSVQQDIIDFLETGNHIIHPISMANKDVRISTCASIYITEKVKYGN